ncbi:MAG: PBSX family phage terminase large subunit [Ruminococcus sp.]|jgi:PBSX family phage terminase large subunit|nr:PBSX family phage terminase large subunit [Ruminococcus sp.]
MTFRKLSDKQKLIFRWAHSKEYEGYRGIIADGAVRTGKTVCMTASFIIWAMKNFSNKNSGKNFGICGKTIRSTERNIIRPLEDISDITKYFRLNYRRSDSLLIITDRKTKKSNNFYIFGGRDDSSFMLIQGITLSGVLFDEAALMPESFIEQATARTISEAASKLWFNCNPESKHSYFYKNWIQKAEEKKLLRVTLLLPDNPILTPEQISEAERMYSGVFRERYIYGRWVNAEGVIYREYADDPERYALDDEDDEIIFATIGIDFGGNGSAHAAVLTGFTRGYKEVHVLDELYIKELITPARLEAAVIAFAKRAREKYIVREAYCDSAEQVLIKGIRAAFARERLPIEVKNARKGSIQNRISCENMLFSTDRLKISRNCVHLSDAFSSAVWDDNGRRLDNGSTNIDSLDAFEYSIEAVMNSLI